MSHYFFDESKVRYSLVQTRTGKPLNWLFLPGGPGADSRYLISLLHVLDLPGNVWLIDLPGNGDHIANIGPDYNFDCWLDIFIPIIARFKNPVCVGHSFGAMLPLLFPKLENHLSGLIALNSAPSLWLEAAVNHAKDHDLPDLTAEMQDFTNNPNTITFQKALVACLPYYFPQNSLAAGKRLLADLPFQYQPAVWWQRKAIESNYSASWVPDKVPMLVIGGEYDYITPFSIYERDQRFHKPNIKMTELKGCGHMPWIENPKEVSRLFHDFCESLVVNET